MNVALGSIFRNASGYIGRYYAQCLALEYALSQRGDTLRLILAEGDSVDVTWGLLTEWRPDWLSVDLFKRAHGGPYYKSTLHAARMAQMAYCQNGVIEKVTERDDAFIYVESDLIWKADAMLRLLDDLSDERAIVAPMMMHHNGRFYDSWAYRRDGRGFSFYYPYHPAYADTGDLMELDSAGSCLVMRGDVARSVRFQREDCIVGLCRDAKAHGYHIWLDKRAAVVHPPDGSEDRIPGEQPEKVTA